VSPVAPDVEVRLHGDVRADMPLPLRAAAGAAAAVTRCHGLKSVRQELKEPSEL
jgi:hypothetical protein